MRVFDVVLPGLLVLALALAPPPAIGDEIRISLDTIRISDEDDPLSNDEPYVVMVGIRMRVDPQRLIIVPSTLTVRNVMSGHGSLRPGENWADEVHTYPITAPHVMQDSVPSGEPGWVVAALVFHFEKDGFSASTARALSDAVRTEIQNSLQATAASGTIVIPGTGGITDAVTRSITGSLGRSVTRLNLPGLIRGIASVADPDDFGGVNALVVVSDVGNAYRAYVGFPRNIGDAIAAAQEIQGQLRTLSSAMPFSLGFPQGGLGGISFEGRHTINGQIAVTRTPARGRVVGATLSASPTAHSGPCPTVINFRGEIAVDGPTQVTYVFTRSDGATDTVQRRLNFTAAGRLPVTTTWSLGGRGFSYSGWQTLRVLTPNSLESSRAVFTLRCP